jgi:transketolase
LPPNFVCCECTTKVGSGIEGSCWEALIFARHHWLENLTVLVDLNGLQGFGSTREVADLEPLAAKFRSFGLPTLEVDGHDHRAIEEALRSHDGGLQVIVAQTRKGCGVSYMEDRMEWHYLPMTEVQYRQAVQEIGEACVTLSASP